MAGSSCPHECSRCRAIEAGVGGRPLTLQEFQGLHEILVGPPREPVWAPDTAEAALGLELAETAWQEAHRTHRDVVLELDRERAGTRRYTELSEALSFTGTELADADAHVLELRVRHRQLAERDLAHQREQEELAEQEAAAPEREQAARRRRRAGRSLIRRVTATRAEPPAPETSGVQSLGALREQVRAQEQAQDT